MTRTTSYGFTTFIDRAYLSCGLGKENIDKDARAQPVSAYPVSGGGRPEAAYDRSQRRLGDAAGRVGDNHKSKRIFTVTSMSGNTLTGGGARACSEKVDRLFR